MQKITPPHVIAFEGTTNFRELGGYPAAGGRRVRHGFFYRGGTLHDIQSPSDRALLQSLGLKTVLDLRSQGERKISPDFIPEGARYLAVSAMRYDNGDEIDFSPEGMKRLELEYEKLGSLSISRMLERYYARMPFLNPAYQTLFKVLEQEEVPILFHCTSGKDRTGVGAMLILLALGADRETALFDYLETNRCREREIQLLKESRRDLAEQNPEEFELLLIGLGVLPKFANAALDAIFEKYETAEEYFKEEFGLDERRLKALRDKYLE